MYSNSVITFNNPYFFFSLVDRVWQIDEDVGARTWDGWFSRLGSWQKAAACWDGVFAGGFSFPALIFNPAFGNNFLDVKKGLCCLAQVQRWLSHPLNGTTSRPWAEFWQMGRAFERYGVLS
jgi:hypothetical protein